MYKSESILNHLFYIYICIFAMMCNKKNVFIFFYYMIRNIS